MTDRFDLENAIAQCWQITSDIPLLEEEGASVADMVSLATVYDYKFRTLWHIFEALVREDKFVKEE
jgi:hypothetical protein